MAETAKVGVLIEAEDKASATLKGFSSNLGGLGTALKGLAVVGTAVFAGMSAIAVSSLKEMADAQKDMVQASNNLENAIKGLNENQLSALTKGTKNTKDALSALSIEMTKAGESALKLGFDDESASVAFSKLYASSNDVAQAQRDLQLAMDLSAYSGRGLEESAQAVLKVHSGATKVLKEFGIEVAEGTTALDALKIMNDKTSDSALKASKTFEGQGRILSEQFNNIKQSIGESLAPMLQMILDKVQPLVQLFADWARQLPAFIEQLKGLDDWFVKLMQTFDMQTGLITVLKEAWEAVWVVFEQQLLPSLRALWESLEPLQPFLIALSKVAGTILVMAFYILIEAVKFLAIVFIEVLKVVTDLATFLTKVFAGAINGTIDLLSNAFNWVTKLINAIKELNVLQSVKNYGASVMGGIKELTRVNDAVISPQGNVISTSPQDYLIATKNPASLVGGGGMVVNINGGNYLSESAALMLGDELINRLRMQMKI